MPKKTVIEEAEELLVHALSEEFDDVVSYLGGLSPLRAAVVCWKLSEFVAPHDPYKGERLFKFLKEKAK